MILGDPQGLLDRLERTIAELDALLAQGRHPVTIAWTLHMQIVSRWRDEAIELRDALARVSPPQPDEKLQAAMASVFDALDEFQRGSPFAPNTLGNVGEVVRKVCLLAQEDQIRRQNAEKELAALAARVSVPTEPLRWRCFTCDKVFTQSGMEVYNEWPKHVSAAAQAYAAPLAAVVAPPPQKEFDWRVRLGNLIDRKNMMGDFKFGMAVVDLIYDYDRLAVAPPQPHTEQK